MVRTCMKQIGHIDKFFFSGPECCNYMLLFVIYIYIYIEREVIYILLHIDTLLHYTISN